MNNIKKTIITLRSHKKIFLMAVPLRGGGDIGLAIKKKITDFFCDFVTKITFFVASLTNYYINLVLWIFFLLKLNAIAKRHSRAFNLLA